MSNLEDKKKMIPMNYYNEYNNETLYFQNMRFLGINYKNKNHPLMHFELADGTKIIRQLADTMRYEIVVNQ